jgi:CheY-like chemotaxis protein
LDLSIDAEVPQFIFIDAKIFRQIFINLVGNAIKFTPTNGRVNVSVTWETRKGKCGLLIVIQDTGCGIDQENQGKLFQPFIQEDSSVKHRYGGTGLGLSISKRFAETMGGDVNLKFSAPEKGSVFELFVPISEFSQSLSSSGFVLPPSSPFGKTDKPRLKEDTLKGIQILLVEDRHEIAESTIQILQMFQCHVDWAETSLIAQEKADSKYYDLVLMDHALPGVNGGEAAINLRNSGFLNPILSLTAKTLKNESEYCQQYKINGVIHKPMQVDVLIQEIMKHLEIK